MLSRPYPRAAPGRLLSLESDGEAGTMQLTGIADGAAAATELDLWWRQYASNAGSGLGNMRLVEITGGYRALIVVSGSYRITVAPR